jgi:hypothetical protein
MVSELPYFSGKTLRGGHWSALAALVAATTILGRHAGFAGGVPAMLCGLVGIYAASGLVCHRRLAVPADDVHHRPDTH